MEKRISIITIPGKILGGGYADRHTNPQDSCFYKYRLLESIEQDRTSFIQKMHIKQNADLSPYYPKDQNLIF